MSKLDRTGRLVAALISAFLLGALPSASRAQDDLRGFYTPNDYVAAEINTQIGYTTGLIDAFLCVFAQAPNRPAFEAVADCVGTSSVGGVSILYDEFLAANPDVMDAAGAEVFIAMLADHCADANVFTLIDDIMIGQASGGGQAPRGGPAPGGGQAVAAPRGCTPVSQFPKELLVEMTRTGQLLELYAAGAVCRPG